MATQTRRRSAAGGRGILCSSHQRQERRRRRSGFSATCRRHRRGHRSTPMIDTVAAAAVDAFGLTDRGLVRDGNEDHFLLARVTKSVDVRQTSLPSDAIARELAEAGGYLLAVADGVGGGPEGDVASERALSAILSHVGQAATCFQSRETSAEHSLF